MAGNAEEEEEEYGKQNLKPQGFAGGLANSLACKDGNDGRHCLTSVFAFDFFFFFVVVVVR